MAHPRDLFILVLVALVALGYIPSVSGRAKISALRGQEAGPHDRTYQRRRRYLQLFGRGNRMRGNGSQGGAGASISMESRPVMRTQVPTPTPAPSPSIPTTSCEPTTGQCVPMSSIDLQATLDNASDGDTIALCGGNTHLLTASDLAVERSNLTICCATLELCTLESTGTDRIFTLFGLLGATLRGLRFRNGISPLIGGNVLIQGSSLAPVGQRGEFLIENCRFEGGNALFGGNLAVGRVDRIVVRDCIFVDGKSTSEGSGGNLYVSGESQEPVGTAIIERSSFNSGLSSRGANVFIQSIADVSINGSSITNGAGFLNVNSQGGGASISNSFDVVISNSTFEGNKCSFSGVSGESVIGARGGGALITLVTNDVVISDSSFQDNECSFGGNLAVSTVDSNVLVSRSTFDRGVVPDKAEGRGAGALIANVNAAVIISGSTFEGNKCSFATEGRGGGLRVVTAEEVVVGDSIFQDNECSISGGNLDINFVNNVMVARSSFKRGVITDVTEGRSGNVELVEAQNVWIEESSFEEGKASIYANMLISGAQVVLTSSNFSNNIADVVGDTGIDGSENVAIGNSTFVRSTLSIIRTTETITIEDCSFRDGTSDTGGNLRISAGTEKQIVVRSSTFEGGATPMPASIGQGGNLYISGSSLFAADVTIEQSIFDGGKSYRNGGNLFVSGIKQLTIDDSTFLNGYSEVGAGGDAAIRTINATISRSIIAGGQALSGGGIYIFTSPELGTEVSILSSTFELNSADTFGGAFGLNGEDFPAALTIVGTDFISNSADNTGGVGVIVGSSVQFSLTENTADGNVGSPCNAIVTSIEPCLDVNGGTLPV